jgi:hypothetical protein
MLHELSRRHCAGSGFWWLAGLALLHFGCQRIEPAPIEPKPAPTSADGIPAAGLGGELVGKPFVVQSARYVVDRRHGYEKVDISLSAGSVEFPCDTREPKDSPSVWLRRKGSDELKAEQARIGPKDQGPWEVHYQVRRERHWVGNGQASALIVVHDVGPDMKLTGELSACFRDAHGSCVAGRFAADYCPIRIDQPVRGTEAMERPPAMDRGSRIQPGDAAVAADARTP